MNKKILTIFSLFLMTFIISCSNNSSSNGDNLSSNNEARRVSNEVDNCEVLPLEEQGACLQRVQEESLERQINALP